MERAAVIGAGTMGHGIAQVLAAGGLEVAIADATRELAEKGCAKARAGLAKAAELGKMPAAGAASAAERLHAAASLEEACGRADLVIEAIPEDMALKKATFGAADRAAPGTALLATNTSSLSVTEIAQATGRPDRVLGLHFFNPPPVMKLVEVVRGERTSAAAVESALALVRRLGKEPVVVRDVAGFATSRLGCALGLEAMRMVEEGVASPAEIDRAIELGYRHPMGPLKLTDWVGLDVRLAVAEHLRKELGERFAPPSILRRMVRAGMLGKKTGQGFYRWEGDTPVAPRESGSGSGSGS